MILLHRMRRNLTPSFIRIAFADRMKPARPTFLNKASQDISRSFSKMGFFPRTRGRQTTDYQCLARMVHLVSAARCYNKLPVVLRLPQHLTPPYCPQLLDSTTYFLDPDSRLLSPIASEVSCSALFPAVYQTHSGWIAVTPDIHQALSPKPLPIPPPRRTEDVFREQDYNEGGLYRSATLDAMQDFLLTPLLREAVTYKLAHQVHNLRA